jgi:hypothetical protein
MAVLRPKATPGAGETALRRLFSIIPGFKSWPAHEENINVKTSLKTLLP